jgi:hypothetical protein
MTPPQDDALDHVNSGRAPTPFTADQIRQACPAGRVMTLLVDMAGASPHYRRIRFVSVDSIGASQEVSRFSLDHEPIGAAETVYATWSELQAHASFERSDTTIDSDTIDTQLGRLDCLRYSVVDGATAHTFWFALKLPGMPVRFTAAENGAIIGSTTMISNATTP